jgi:hypothetical protein
VMPDVMTASAGDEPGSMAAKPPCGGRAARREVAVVVDDDQAAWRDRGASALCV